LSLIIIIANLHLESLGIYESSEYDDILKKLMNRIDAANQDKDIDSLKSSLKSTKTTKKVLKEVSKQRLNKIKSSLPPDSTPLSISLTQALSKIGLLCKDAENTLTHLLTSLLTSILSHTQSLLSKSTS
jgi:GTP1/Obg family GTP-binding protein